MNRASTDFRCGRGLQLRRVLAIDLLGSVTLFAFASIANAAVIESRGTRHEIALPKDGTPEISHVFSQPAVAGVPPLTEVTIYNDNRYKIESPAGTNPAHEIRGYNYGTSSKSRSDDVYVFTGYSVLDPDGGWAGGTGPYAGAAGFNLFAGFGWSASATMNAYTATDVGYLVAPGVATPAHVVGDISDGKLHDTSRLTNAAQGFHDVSRTITGLVVNNDEGPQITPLALTLPFALTQETLTFDGPSELSGSFQWTGPGNNHVEGIWVVGSEFCSMCMPTLAIVPLPGTEPFVSGEQRVILTGYQEITGGAGDGYIVTGGRIGFIAIERYDSPTAVTGLLDLQTYGWIEVQAIPEPDAAVLMLAGIAMLAVLSIRRRTATVPKRQAR
jgi:hypothetical protein